MFKIHEPKANTIYSDPYYMNKRLELPSLKKTFNFNVWGVLKDAVGKDLSKFCVPGNVEYYQSVFQRAIIVPSKAM